MLFCPTCANMLLVEKSKVDFRFFCKTCPYIFVVQDMVFENTMVLPRKEVDDVMGGEDAWQNCVPTKVKCPNVLPKPCVNDKAYYKEI